MHVKEVHIKVEGDSVLSLVLLLIIAHSALSDTDDSGSAKCLRKATSLLCSLVPVKQWLCWEWQRWRCSDDAFPVVGFVFPVLADNRRCTSSVWHRHRTLHCFFVFSKVCNSSPFLCCCWCWCWFWRSPMPISWTTFGGTLLSGTISTSTSVQCPSLSSWRISFKLLLSSAIKEPSFSVTWSFFGRQNGTVAIVVSRQSVSPFRVYPPFWLLLLLLLLLLFPLSNAPFLATVATAAFSRPTRPSCSWIWRKWMEEGASHCVCTWSVADRWPPNLNRPMMDTSLTEKEVGAGKVRLSLDDHYFRWLEWRWWKNDR